MNEIWPTDHSSHVHGAGRRSMYWSILFAVGVAMLTPLPFLPTLGNDFVNWDDPGLILENVRIQNLGWQQIRWMFTSFHMGPYEPLPLLTLALDYSLWGPDARGFHISSLLWHTANAIGFYVLVRRLLVAAMPVAANRPLLLGMCSTIAAIFFAVHPLRVESVAWAAGRLDVVAAFFGIWTVWAYTKAAEFGVTHSGSRRWLVLALLFYALSLLSKASTLLLPAVLSVLDFYPYGRLSRARWWPADPLARRVWMEKIPFWILSFIAAAVGLYGRSTAGAIAPLAAYGPIDRIALAGFSGVFYVVKTLIPVRLSPLYELPDEISIWEPQFLVATAATVFATVLLVRYWRAASAAGAAWIVYLILVLPVSGVAQTGAQLAADRYSYLPCLSFAVLLGGLSLAWLLATANSGRAVAILLTLFFTGSLVLGRLSWRQTEVWRDSQSLWRYALRIDPNSTKALTSLACAIAEQGELAQARELLEKAIRVRPKSHFAHWNLGVVLERTGETDQAILHYREAWKWNPRSFNVAQALGSLYQEKRDWPEAAVWYERALTQRPDSPKALSGLGTVRTALGELDRAVVLLERAIEIEPADAIARNSLGIALRRMGKSDRALEQFLEAWRLDPHSADISYNLGYLFLVREDWQSAIEWYERALAVNPRLVKALNDMGIAHKKHGAIEEAMQWYRAALEADPRSTEARYNLALALADQANEEEAVAEYGRVLDLDRTHVAAAHHLAALLVKRGEFFEALRTLEATVQATNHPVLMQRLSWLLATAPDDEVRDGPRAVRLAEHVAERTEANAQVLDTLAAAYAEAGKFSLAVETASRALQLASRQELTDLAHEIEARRALYRAGKAYRAD